MPSKPELIREVGAEMRAFQTAVDAFDDAAAAHLGINRSALLCLDLLGQRGAMTAGDVAEATGLTTGAVTRLVDRLEEAGYAVRTRDAEDRRRVLVELTPLAHERSAALYGPIGKAGEARLGRYTAEELALLRDFLRSGRELYEERMSRVPLARSR